MAGARPDMLMIKQIQLALQKELWDRYQRTVAHMDQITLHMTEEKPQMSFNARDEDFSMAFVGDVQLSKVPGTVYVGDVCGIPFFVSGSAYNNLACPLFVPAWFAKEVQENAATSVAQWEVKLLWSVEKRTIVKNPAWCSDIKAFTFAIPVLRAVQYGVAYLDI